MAKLEDPYPSPPGRPGAYALYIGRRDDPEGLCDTVVVLAAAYATCKFLRAVVGEDEYVFEGDNYLRTERGVVVRHKFPGIDAYPPWHKKHDPERARWTVRDVFERDLTLAEMAWQLTDPYLTEALRCRAMTVEGVSERVAEVRERRAAVHRASRDGMVPVSDLAVELNLTPRDVRQALRRAKVAKPAQGWAFPAADIEQWRETVRKALGR